MVKRLTMVVPCYNEEEVIEETASRLKDKYTSLIENKQIANNSTIIFVNDGSGDNTWGLIKALHDNDSVFCGLSLSRNYGHQNALLAGLMVAAKHADMVITMDCDLQDDINSIDGMISAFYAGHDIVYGVRTARRKDRFIKKHTAQGFYRLMHKLGVEIVYNHADFRLMSKRAVIALGQFKEINLFLRGVVPMVGFPSTTVEYERGERFAGETKYPFKKMIAFAIEGITSLSVRPIRAITVIGLLSFVTSFIMLIYFVIDYIRGGTVDGWASLIVSIWALGGLQLLAIGIIGEYIGKIYLEAKARPRYIISEEVLNEEGV